MPPKFTTKEIPISQIDNNFGQIEGVPENPRTITTEDFQNLKKSLDDDPGFLWLREPLVYPLKGRYVAIAGNQRIRALKELPVEFTPAKILDKNTPIDDLIRWAIKDNTSKGEWDWDALANEWDADALIEWGIDMPEDWGTTEELPENIDDIPQAPKKPISKMGDLWLLGDHRVLCGDSTDQGTVERLMDGKKAELLLTSPPYGVGMEYEDSKPDYEKTKQLVESVFNNSKISIKQNGFAFVNFGERFSFPQMMGQLYRDIFDDWHFYDMRYWKRSNVGMAIWNTTQPRCMSDMESLFTWQNGKKLYPVHNLEISKQSLWQESGSSAGIDHPAVMATGIAINALTIYTTKNNLVIDPFLGAGTTTIACEQTDRICYGLELDPLYVDVICKRWQTLTGQMPVLESTGEAHDFCS